MGTIASMATSVLLVDAVNGVIHAVEATTMTMMLGVVVILAITIQRPHPRLMI